MTKKKSDNIEELPINTDVVPSDADIPEASWNLAKGLTIQMANLMSMAQLHYVSGDYRKGFECMHGVKLCFTQDLDPEERKSLKEKRDKLVLCFRADSILRKPLGMYPEEDETKSHKVSISFLKGKDIVELVVAYHENIIDKLGKYGYLIPKKQSSRRI